MEKVTNLILFTCLLQTLHVSSSQGEYTPLVMEYMPRMSSTGNIENYKQFIEKAAKSFSADIIVFPEGTLSTIKGKGSLVPNPEDGIIPYKNETYKEYKVVTSMSEAAAQHKIYVVVNIHERVNCGNESTCPGRGYFAYNTNVAFDRNGRVVARYRKYHPYDEGVDVPEKGELSAFNTDFGVTFGMFTCFDILFKTPAVDLVRQKNIKHIIFPTFWFGELPFLTAVQMQVGWSYAMNVTLLASGSSVTEIGSTGSGIYLGRKQGSFLMLEKSKNVMISKKVSADVDYPEEVHSQPSRSVLGLKLKEDPSIPSAIGKDLNFGATEFKEEICHNGFCCNFKIQYRKLNKTNSSNYTYRAVAFKGIRYFGENARHEVAYCAVLLCSGGNCAKKPLNKNFPLAFDNIKINANFEKDNFQMPNTLVWRDDIEDTLFRTMDFSHFKFDKKEIGDKDNISIELIKREVVNLITFAIFGRIFDDERCNTV